MNSGCRGLGEKGGKWRYRVYLVVSSKEGNHGYFIVAYNIAYST